MSHACDKHVTWVVHMKKRSKNTNEFVQVTRGYIADMRHLATKSALAHSVLWVLVERMNKTNAVVISQTALSEILGSPRGSISRAISTLKDNNWIQIVKIGSSNAYVVNSRVVWTANNRTGHRYAVFNAEVVATETEQAQREIEAWENLELKHVPVISKTETPISGNEELPPPDQKEIDTGLDDIPLIEED